MATKVDQTVAAESLHMHSAITTNSPKVSKFASKSGFVIPKNKLSGSLVPTMRHGGKGDPGISLRDDSSKQVQRKTKWGLDMTQDADIKKGRILAYQTRLEQLTEQLKAGLLEFGNDKSLKSSTQSSTNDHAMQHQNLEQLELEKREIIGEILQLNPSFKPPSDYKPLLKEAKVPIPIKVHPEYNFFELLLGSESNTQKRLEEETGAKVAVYGTKSDTKEKHEITQSKLNEVQRSYEELYVHVSADTYKKVDAAVALLELLFTPVSGNSESSTESRVIAAESAHVVPSQMQSCSSYMMTTVTTINQAAAQSVPAEPGPMMFQAHHNPSYPLTSSGYSLPPQSQFTSTASNNSVRFAPPLVNHSNMPPFNAVNSPFGLVPRDSAGVGGGSQTPLQILQQPPNQAAPLQMSLSTYSMSTQSTSTLPASFSANTIPRFFETIPANRATPQTQPPPMVPVGSLPMPLGPSSMPGNSTGWPSAPPVTSVGSNNFRGNPHPVLLPRGILHPGMIGKPVVGIFAGAATLSSQSSIGAPSFSSASSHISVNPTSTLPITGSTVNLLPKPGQPPTFLPSLAPRPWPISALSSSSMLASASSPVAALQVPVVSIQSPSLSMANTSFVPVPLSATLVSKIPTQPLFQIAPISTSVVPTSMTRPPRPNPGDFTFQPLRAQVAGLVTPRPDNLLTSHMTAQSQRPAVASQVPSTMLSTQNPLPVPQTSLAQTNSQVLTGAPHAQPFRLPMPNLAMPMGGIAIPRPHDANMFGSPRAPFPPFPSSAIGNLGDFSPLSRPRFPSSQNSAPVNQFSIRETPGFLPLRTPPNLMPLQKPLLPAAQQHGFLPPPNQHLGKVSLDPLGNQFYDPFSPTSIPNAPRQKKNEQAKLGNPEPDSEYEDLMASVGVR